MNITLEQLFEICNENLTIRIHDCNGDELGCYDGKNSIDVKYNNNIVIYQQPRFDEKELYVELHID